MEDHGEYAMNGTRVHPSEEDVPTEETLSWTALEPVRISAYTNQSRVSHSVSMRENSAEEFPKQSSLERSL